MKLQKPAVAARAIELGLPVVQPAKIREEAFLQQIAGVAPDIGVVVAYGRILPARLLEIPKHGFVNVHGSLLPKYRGAAPMQRAVEAGETQTGVTIMRVDEALDHGPMFEKVVVEIGADEKLPSLAARLATAGAAALARTLQAIERGEAVETEQDHASATHAAKIEKEEGRVTFAEPWRVIYDRYRAFDPWPGVSFETEGEIIRITQMSRAEGGAASRPRTLLAIDQGVLIATGDGALRLERLQRPGKAAAAAGDVARGLGWRVGAVLP